MIYELRFYSDDDRDPKPDDAIAVARTSRKVPGIGEAVTLVARDGQSNPRRYRVVDVDHGYVAQHPTGTNFNESTVAVYVMDADDPRRLGE